MWVSKKKFTNITPPHPPLPSLFKKKEKENSEQPPTPTRPCLKNNNNLPTTINSGPPPANSAKDNSIGSLFGYNWNTDSNRGWREPIATSTPWARFQTRGNQHSRCVVNNMLEGDLICRQETLFILGVIFMSFSQPWLSVHYVLTRMRLDEGPSITCLSHRTLPNPIVRLAFAGHLKKNQMDCPSGHNEPATPGALWRIACHEWWMVSDQETVFCWVPLP